MKKIKKPVSVLLSLIMIFALFAIVPVTASAATQNVTFIGEDGSPQSVTATILNNNDNLLPGGWYVLNRSITFNSTLQFSNSTDEYVDVNLILRDGCTLYLKNSNTGIKLNSKMNLNIYAESTNGTGAIESSSYKTIELTDNNATLNVYGGNITATDNENAHILCYGDININGGTIQDCGVQANKTLTINGGTITNTFITGKDNLKINGGTINCDSAECLDGDIVLNLIDVADSITAADYNSNSGLVRFANVMTDGTTNYTVGSTAQASDLADKTLRAVSHTHTYDDPIWVWNGYTSATATFVCTVCHKSVTLTDNEIDSQITLDPGNTTTGVGTETYYASVEFNGTTYNNTKEKKIDAAHNFGNFEWTWNGYESASLTAVCSLCDEVATAEAEITCVTVEPTETANGKNTYTATAVIDGTSYTDEKTEVLPRLGTPYFGLDEREHIADAEDINDFVSEQHMIPGGTAENPSWCVISGNVTVDSRIDVTNNANLILADGAVFTAHKGITVGADASLNIWAQSGGTGKLIVDDPLEDYPGVGSGPAGGMFGSSESCGAITINGGDINVIGAKGAGIGCRDNVLTAKGSVTINRGKVIASCTGEGAGIGGKRARDLSITINGGDVTATGGSGCAGIGLGVGKVTVNIYDADVTATGGENAAAIGGQGGTITVNVNSGKVTATESNINVEKLVEGGVFDQEDAEKANPAGIGAVLGDATIHLGWNNANSDSIYADSYGGTVTLLKKFKDKINTSTVFDTGVLSDPAAIAGITLIPSCEHPVWSEPVWEFSWDADNNRANATATFTCTTCGEQEVKGDDYYEVHQYSASDEGYYRTYTFGTTFNETEYISPAATFARHLDISVSGVYIDKDNCGDVLGDGGSVSYDIETNTLTLNNATIQLFKNDSYSTASAIEYAERGRGDKFTIRLIGTNKITDTDVIGKNTSAKWGVYTHSNVSEQVFTGGGTLDISLTSEESCSTIAGLNYYDHSSLKIDGSSVSVNVSEDDTASQSNYSSITGVYLWNSDQALITLKNGAVLTSIVESDSDCAFAFKCSTYNYIGLNISEDPMLEGSCPNKVNDNCFVQDDDTIRGYDIKDGAYYNLDSASREGAQQIGNTFEPLKTAKYVRFPGDWKISVSGIGIDRLNCDDVLGDGGKVKYDLATNTLTLNNATIQLMNTGTYTSAYGISYGHISDLPFTVKLIGTNKIVDNEINSSDQLIYTKYAFYDSLIYNEEPPSYIFTGGGRLDVQLSGDSRTECDGIRAYSTLKFIGCRVNVKVTTEDRASGVYLRGSDSELRLETGAELRLDVTGKTSEYYTGAVMYGTLNNPFKLYVSDDSLLEAKCNRRVFREGLASPGITGYDKSRGGLYNPDAPSKNGALSLDEETNWYRVLESKYVLLPGNRDLFVGHSISLNGNIALNFYLDPTPEELDAGITVNMVMPRGKDEPRTKQVTLDQSNYDTKTGYYKISFELPVAEMSYEVTASPVIAGGDTCFCDTFSVKEYGEYIISNDYKAIYTANNAHTEAEYNTLSDLVKAMLDYGAKAQIAFDRTDARLANESNGGEDFFSYDVTSSDMRAINSESISDMRNGDETLGLEYQGSTVVYLSETTLRHYYKIIDAGTFEGVMNTLENFTYGEKGDYIYFEYRDIPAQELSTPQILTIGGKSFGFSPLTYGAAALESNRISAAEKELVKAMYRYNRKAVDYRFD